MRPAAAAILPPAIRVTPKARRCRYSIGLIRRCRPGRGGVSHHLRRRFAAVLSLGAFIGMPPAERGVGHPITYQRDITLISGLSMVVVLTGRVANRVLSRVVKLRGAGSERTPAAAVPGVVALVHVHRRMGR